MFSGFGEMSAVNLYTFVISVTFFVILEFLLVLATGVPLKFDNIYQSKLG